MAELPKDERPLVCSAVAFEEVMRMTVSSGLVRLCTYTWTAKEELLTEGGR